MKKNSSLSNPEFSILISAYRNSLIQRYSIENLERFPKYSKIDRNLIDRLISYFLELLYPPYEDRLKLDNAFKSLASFVHSPSKFFGIMGDIGGMVFKFGRHFPRAIRAGVSSLSSYLTAHKFEETLFFHAKDMILEGKDLLSYDEFNRLIAKIPKKEAEKFRKDVVELFHTLTEVELLNKIIEIMRNIISKMKSKPGIYSESEIYGIEMGLSIISKGKNVFHELNPSDIQLVLSAIDDIEKDFFENAIIGN
ncbi:MAG: hypothetical protein L6Q54_00220 [Leptospiraceae bacterium]|nr:hypothetical protein [Leptospiraceae bacterium]MCK6379661.1 hypothetical protein [Leptospiraceae bacterium]NUM40115.1 hypothetical protein [Leptospiraceae bacterium]